MPQLENKHRMLCFFLSLEEFLEIKNMISGEKIKHKVWKIKWMKSPRRPKKKTIDEKQKGKIK